METKNIIWWSVYLIVLICAILNWFSAFNNSKLYGSDKFCAVFNNKSLTDKEKLLGTDYEICAKNMTYERFNYSKVAYCFKKQEDLKKFNDCLIHKSTKSSSLSVPLSS